MVGIGRCRLFTPLALAFLVLGCGGGGDDGDDGAGDGSGAGTNGGAGSEDCLLTGGLEGYADVGGALTFTFNGTTYEACGATALKHDGAAGEALIMVQGYGVDAAGTVWSGQVIVEHPPGTSATLSCGPGVICSVQFSPAFDPAGINSEVMATTDPDGPAGSATIEVTELSDTIISGTFEATLVSVDGVFSGGTLTAGAFVATEITNAP